MCGKSFSKKQALRAHEKSCKTVNRKLVQSHFKCRTCSQVLNSRRELYYHRITQHGGGDGENLQRFQLDSPPWLDAEGNVVDSKMERVYNDNALHILAPHKRGEVVQNYNFPTENLQGGIDEIMSHIEEIYNTEENSFRINMSFGFILRNRESGEYRYYIPYTNSYLFQTPHVVTRRGSLRSLKNKLRKINPEKYMREHTPDSKWELVYITNIHFDITLMNYLLGESTELPKHVHDSKSIFTFLECKNTNLPYNDNLCFFRCLAFHEIKTTNNLDATTEHKFQQWTEYTPVKHRGKFPGIRLTDIPDLENCFQININVFQLLANQSVIVHYKSLSNFDGTLHCK